MAFEEMQQEGKQTQDLCLSLCCADIDAWRVAPSTTYTRTVIRGDQKNCFIL